MKDLEKFLNYAIAIVVLIIGASFFIFKSSPEKAVHSTSAKTESVDQVVNKHLQQTVIQVEVNKLRTERALDEARKKVVEELELARKKRESEAAKIPAEQQVWTEEKIRNQPTSSLVTTAPAHVPKSQIEQPVNVESLTEDERKEYAKQFIENARKAGYKIELDENLEVKNATPIRKPSQLEDSVEYPYSE